MLNSKTIITCLVDIGVVIARACGVELPEGLEVALLSLAGIFMRLGIDKVR